MGFTIRGERLEAYTGSDEHVVIPDGVGIIEDNVFKGCSSLISVATPESVRWIGKNAFQGCTNLTDVTLSKNIRYIGSGAFEGCAKLTNLTLPENCEKISERTFMGCESLRDVTIPKGVQYICESAFSGCINLRNPTLPEKLWSIGRQCFKGCRRLTDVIIPENMEFLDGEVFRGCESIEEIVVPEKVNKIQANAFTGCIRLRKVTCKSERITVHKSSFNKCPALKEIYMPADRAEEARQYVDKNVRFFSLDGAPIEFAWEKVTPGTSAKADEADKPFLAAVEAEMKPAELIRWAEKQGLNSDRLREVRRADGSGYVPLEAVLFVLYSYMTQIPKPPVYRSKSFRTDVAPVRIVPAADRLAAMMDTESLCAMMAEQLPIRIACDVYIDVTQPLPPMNLDIRMDKPFTQTPFNAVIENRYEGMLRFTISGTEHALPYCRYADEEGISALIDTMRTLTEEWETNGKRAVIALRSALQLSDTQKAVSYFDKLGMLETYAKIRGLTATVVRYQPPVAKSARPAATNTAKPAATNTAKPEAAKTAKPAAAKRAEPTAGKSSERTGPFGFDADGIKRYDMDGRVIEVSISPDLGFHLYDAGAKKAIRSFPSKDRACAEDYAQFKKSVLQSAKECAKTLHRLHMSGELLPQELWRDTFVKHPVHCHLTQLLVWQDQTEKSFMTHEGGIIDSNGRTYAPVGGVRLAHVLSMSAADVNAWQSWLIRNGKTQLFEQIWEPVTSISPKELATRYKGVVLSKEKRGAVKSTLELRGITVKSDDMKRTYNPYTFRYEFSNRSVLNYGTSVKIDYTVDPQDGSTTLGACRVEKDPNRRELNAVVLELEKAAAFAIVSRDMDPTLLERYISTFTAAQISVLLEAAIAQNATRCIAMLMDYRNKHFPESATMERFTLDW